MYYFMVKFACIADSDYGNRITAIKCRFGFVVVIQLIF